MSNLIAIVKATRASANAIASLQNANRMARDAERESAYWTRQAGTARNSAERKRAEGFAANRARDVDAWQALARIAQARLNRAQSILGANPLHGDATR
jgi:hypothetical protein